MTAPTPVTRTSPEAHPVTPPQNFGAPTREPNPSANQNTWIPFTWLTVQRARCLGCGRPFVLSPSWDAATCPECHQIFLGKMGSAHR